VNPVVAVLLGTLVLGEPLTWRTLVGGGIILASVALIVSAPKPRGVAERRQGALAARAR
jgi:drug/metabolite transporter (DMT)-like permease